jgi:hypothetical protein
MKWLAFLITAQSFASQLSAQTAVPVQREPRHRLVWEAGAVRVLDVQFSPGDTSLYHVHDAPILYVPISSSAMSVQRLGAEWTVANISEAAAGERHATWSDTVYAVQPLTHRVANVGTTPFRLIAITNSRAPSNVSVLSENTDLPGEVEQSSSWFLQRRITASPGTTSPWYTSQLPLVIVQPAASTSIVEQSPSSAVNELAAPGSWLYLPAGARFRFRNPGADSVMLVFVQVR